MTIVTTYNHSKVNDRRQDTKIEFLSEHLEAPNPQTHANAKPQADGFSFAKISDGGKWSQEGGDHLTPSKEVSKDI